MKYTIPSRFFLVLTLFFLCIPLLSSSTLHAAEGDFVWARGIGGTLDDSGNSITVDSDGNVYITGSFQGTVDFDPGPGDTILVSNGNYDIFISKMNPAGDLVWARSFGSDLDDEGWGIFVDAAGNVYTTGYFQNTVDFDPGPGVVDLTSVGHSDIFISKLDNNGDYVGAWAMGGNTYDYGYGIFTDSTGNIYTTGYFQNTADFDPGAGTTSLISNGVEDIFVSKLDSNGNFAWARGIGGAAFDVGLGISRYSSGHLYLTGWFQGTVDFDPGANTNSLTSVGSDDIFILKLDDNGIFTWARSIGGIQTDTGQAVSVDSQGNVYTTGWFNGTVDFDPGAGTNNLIAAGPVGSDIFISKLDNDGLFVWAKAMGGQYSDVGYGLTVDSSDNVYTTGIFQDTADFDPSPTGTFNLDSSGGFDIFVNKLDSNGDFVWAKSMGGTSVTPGSGDFGFDIAVDMFGNIYTTGFFRGTADFDPSPTGTFNLDSNGGSEDIFISKLSGAVNFPWLLFLPAIITPPPAP